MNILSKVFVVWLSFNALLHGADFYVSPHGKDTAKGTQSAPFATLEKARDAVRRWKQTHATGAGATVWLADGFYDLSTGLVLDAQDSGTSQAPVVYRALPGAQPRIRLGQSPPPDAFQPVTDPSVIARLDPAAKDKLVQLDLKALKIENTKTYPTLFRGNGGLFELFENGQRLKVSRWPNGEYGFTTMKEVLFGGARDNGNTKGGTFVYRGTRAARWTGAVDDGVWLAGFWRVPWVIEGVRVQAIDPEKKTITLGSTISLGIGSKYSKKLPDGTRQGDGKEKWYALNLLEEIDKPGEWCVDFKNQRLYLWPGAPIRPGSLFIADRDQPIITLREASNIRLIGLTLECSLGDAVRVEGGRQITVAGCTVRNVAKRGILIEGGFQHKVQSCDVYSIGLNAIAFSGGDRMRLVPSGHRILNNEIHHAGLYEPTAALQAGSGVGAKCVGNLVAHNRVHDSSNAGVYYSGNDNILEYNEIYRVGLNSGDLGGFYSTGGWTSRGNIVRYNFIHHSPGANAVYLDDGDSGDLVVGNVAYRVMSGALLGGGHDNTLRGNVVVEAFKAGIRIDARGLSRNYTMQDPRLGNDFRAVQPEKDPWHKRFPEMLNLLKNDPRVPSGVVIDGNVLVGCKVSTPNKPEEKKGIALKNNLETSADPGFVDAAGLNFRFKPDASVFKSVPGFQPIPFEKIGLYVDEFRKQIVPRDLNPPDAAQQTDEAFDSETDIKASNAQH